MFGGKFDCTVSSLVFRAAKAREKGLCGAGWGLLGSVTSRSRLQNVIVTTVNIQPLNEKVGGVKSLSGRTSRCYILRASQTFSINLGRSAAETLTEREMQGPKAASPALPRVAFAVTGSIQATAPREQASRFNSVVSVGNCGTGRSWVWRCQEEAEIPSFPASGKRSQTRSGE